MPSTLPLLPLRGKIVHRLFLTAYSSDWSGSKKRRRDETEDLSKLPSADESTEADVLCWKRAGFFFLPFDSTEADKAVEYLLIAPQRLLKVVCDAARFHHAVEIADFDTRPISSCDGNVALLYVHRRGLSLCLDGAGKSIGHSSFDSFARTLSGIKCQRENGYTARSNTAREIETENEAPSKRDKYTFHATVDAISPIIAAVPSDPFALIELYEPGSESPNSCVVVLKGADALSCHGGIQPGDSIGFRDVRRQRWHVPSSFEKKGLLHMVKRAPTHVFVVSDARSIMWNANDREDTPLPSTVIPLRSIEGTVRFVEMKSLGPNGATVIHAVELEISQANESEAPCLLFTTHYPMSPFLHMGISKGSRIRAINVHELPLCGADKAAAYGACLRSTITLVETSMSKTGEDLLFKPPIPFAFAKKRKSCGRYLVQNFLQGNSEWTAAQSLCSQIGCLVPSVDEVEQSICQLVKEQGVDIVKPLGENDRKTKRDPYLEFFDHASDTSLKDQNDGCNMSCHFNKTLQFVVVSVDGLRSLGCSTMLKRMKELSDEETKQVQTGWTSSIHIPRLDLFEKVTGQAVKALLHTKALRIFSIGIVDSVGKDLCPSMLRDKSCTLPMSGAWPQSDFSVVGTNDVVVVDVEAVVVSCVCLGKTNNPSYGETSTEAIPLPPILPIKERSNRCGSCSIMEHDGRLFVISVQLVCAGGTISKNISPSTDKIYNIIHGSCLEVVNSKTQDIYSCLSHEVKPSREKAESILGLLTRQRYRFKKPRNGTFMGFMLTLSHFPVREISPGIMSHVSASELSSLQSIELKLSIDIPDTTMEAVRVAFRKLLGNENGNKAMQEQELLAAAWWQLADCPSSSLLIMSGIDDVIACGSSTCYVPLVNVPTSSIEHGNFGYVRFLCNVDDVTVKLVKVDVCQGKVAGMSNARSPVRFTSIGGRKVLPGALDCHPPRRIFSSSTNNNRRPSSVILGELLSVPPFTTSGVPSASLADLHWRICSDMQNQTQTALAPSMVRCIPGARLLSVSFCRARAECSRCFEPLVRRRGAKKASITSTNHDYDEDIANDRPSFWHLPLPIPGKEAVAEQEATQELASSPVPPPTLVCPNDCPHDYAEIKWECSGILDDGSGQAKLYAEREAALLLLGPSLNVAAIEKGAWLDEHGIMFQKSVPPKQAIRYAILGAQASVGREAVFSGARRRVMVKPEMIWNRLSVEARAEYAMQEHCRYSSEPLRCLDFLVRCKPLSSDACFGVNRTQVEVATPPSKPYLPAMSINVATYSLPPLKLNLVDCSVSQEESNERSWDLVRALQDDRHAERKF